MSRFLSRTNKTMTTVAIGRDALAWRHQGPNMDGQLHTEVLDDHGHTLRTMVDTLKGRSIRWIVGMEQMPIWLQLPVRGARSIEELRKVAQIHIGNRTNNLGDAIDPWAVDGQWHASRPFFCKALRTSLLSLMGTSPVVTSPLELAMSLLTPPWAGQWFALTTEHEAHLLYLERKTCLYLRSFRIAAKGTDPVLPDTLRKAWHMDTIRINKPSESLKWLHLGTTDLELSLEGGITWYSELLQRQLSSRLTHTTATSEAQGCLHLANAFQALGTHP